MVDWDKLSIERFIKHGLSNKEAEYLSNAMKDNSSYKNDEYAKALYKKSTKQSAYSDKTISDNFLREFRANKPSETTKSFFNEDLDKSGYKYAKGEVEPGKDYLDSFSKQKNKLRIVRDEGLANVKSLGASASAMALGYLISETPDLQLTIHGAGEGSDVIPERDAYDKIRKNLMMKGINK